MQLQRRDTSNDIVDSRKHKVLSQVDTLSLTLAESPESGKNVRNYNRRI